MKFIVTADNHLRKDPPICWVGTPEEWMEYQKRCLMAISDASNNYECDIIIAGDLFDAPRVHAEVVTMFLEATAYAYGNIHIIGGNHSLPFHREANIKESSMGIIQAIGGKYIYHVANEECIDGRFEHSFRFNDDITLVHTLCFPSSDDVPFGVEEITPDYLFSKYDTPFIFTGDYHGSFIAKKGDRRVINPGKMTIQTTKEMDTAPLFYIVDTGKAVDVTMPTDKQKQYRVSGSEIIEVGLPYDIGKFSREHIIKKRERNEAIESAMKLIKEIGDDISLDFVANLMAYLEEHKIEVIVKDIINEIKENRYGGKE